ncbi:MAG: bestrophin family ion channel [Bacteroidota bacterium]
MYVQRNIKWSIIWRFARWNLFLFTLYGTAVVALYHWADHQGINASIPFQPLSVIGIAVAFYLGFKNSQSYDRFWEARKIWGGIVNYSRTWGNQVLSFLSTELEDCITDQETLVAIQKRLIYRHIAWLYALTHRLRRPSSFSLDYKGGAGRYHAGRPNLEEWDRDVKPMLSDDEYKYLCTIVNGPTQLIRLQGEDLQHSIEKLKLTNNFRHMELMRSLEEFYNLQGKCERIKNTPFPRQYAFFSKVFVWIFILLLPFGLVSEFARIGHMNIFLTVPFFVVIAWIFSTMEIVGDNSEDPFENFINDVPMLALSRTIEIDLRDMLGEKDLPEPVKAVEGVLM